MSSILKLKTVHKQLLGLTAFALSLGVATILGSGSAQAATLNVAGSCTIPIAINSVNAGSDQAGCTATGPAYTTDDTITIPAGTLTLTADLPQITESVVIQGAGMNSTVIDGDNGQYGGFDVNDVSTVVFKNFSITAWKTAAIYVTSSDVSFENIEADGSGATAGGELKGIFTLNDDGGSHTVTSDNVYIHSMNHADVYLHAFVVAVSDGGHTDATISSTTLSDIHTTGSNGINGIAMHAGIDAYGNDITLSQIEVDGTTSVSQYGELYGINLKGFTGANSMVADNIYIHNFNPTSTNFLIGFALDLGAGNGSVDADVSNITVSDMHNSAGDIIGLSMGAGVFGGGAGGTLTSQIDNATVDNLTASGSVMGFGSIGNAAGHSVTVHTTLINATISGLRGSDSSVFVTPTVAFYSAGLANGSGNVANVTTDVQNSLIVDNLSDSTSSNCGTYDLSSILGGSGGTINTAINSLGNNISDDNSCPGFNQTGDQQNVSNILPTLGPLQNNGGSVPTRALLAGSPAIASGGSVLGVNTDARGVARASACPSVGAYEYEGAVCGTTTTAPAAGGALAPNTGIRSSSQLFNILAGISGLGLVGYAFFKQKRLN